MTKYNKNIELSPSDMELIETALRVVESRPPSDTVNPAVVQDLLGRLHNQKVFYRPKKGIYISG